MSFTPREYRAIYFVAQQRGWKMVLCRRPAVRYKLQNGQIIAVRLASILYAYDRHLKRISRAKVAQNANQRAYYFKEF